MKRLLLLLACLPVLAGAALFEHYALTRQRLQLVVDAAAVRAAYAIADGKDAEAAARARIARTPLPPGGAVAIEYPPESGRFRGWARAARVRVRQPWSPPLVPRRLADRLPFDMVATAVAVPPGPGHPYPVALRVE